MTVEPSGLAPAAAPSGAAVAPGPEAPSGPAGRALALRGRTALSVLLVGALAWVLLMLAQRLALVVLPIGIALLFTALLRPLVNRLTRWGLGRGAATALVVLLFWCLLGAVAYLLAVRATTQLPRLVDEATSTINDLRGRLADGPLDITDKQVNLVSDRAISYLQEHRADLTGQALSGIRVLLDAATGTVLAVFLGLYLIYDGTSVWDWLVRRAVPAAHREQTDTFGRAAYHALAGYLRGQLVVAMFHGTVIGILLVLLHVPLALPLAAFVAVGSLIPIAGALVAGGVAVLVTLAADGPVLAGVVVGMLVLDNQAEAHLLQPFVVGRSVELHPLAIVLGLTAGTVLEGIWGALFVVPLLAALNAGWKSVREPDVPPATDDTVPAVEPQ